MKKIFILCSALFVMHAFAEDPWNCVNALGGNNNQAIASCDGDSPSKIEATSADGVVANNTSLDVAWMYIANNGNDSITQCQITLNGINLFTCQNKVPAKLTVGSYNNWSGIAASNDNLYITSFGSRDIAMCRIGKDGIDIRACNKIKVIGNYSPLNPLIIDNAIYYSSHSKIYRCQLGVDGVIVNARCSSFSLDEENDIKGMRAANNMIYILHNNDYGKPDSIMQCRTTSDGIDGASCNDVSLNGVNLADSNSIYVSSSKVYITNSGKIVQCAVQNGEIRADNCKSNSLGSGLTASYYFNGKLYLTDRDRDSIFQCDMSAKKINEDSCARLKPVGDSKLSSPTSVVIQ